MNPKGDAEMHDAKPAASQGYIDAVADSLGFVLINTDEVVEEVDEKAPLVTYGFVDLKEIMAALAEDPAYRENLGALQRGDINREQSRARTREIVMRVFSKWSATHKTRGVQHEA